MLGEVIKLLPIPFLILDEKLTVLRYSEAFCRFFSLEGKGVTGRNFLEFFSSFKTSAEDMERCARRVLREVEQASMEIGNGGEFREFEKKVIVSFYRVESQGDERILVALQDESIQSGQEHRLRLLQNVSALMRETLDIGKLLFTILTCITAGPALGFSRAFLLLKNEESNTLEGKMAVGPGSPEEANQVWSTLKNKNMTLDDLIEQYEKVKAEEKGALKKILKNLTFSLEESTEIPVQAFHSRESVRITRGGMKGLQVNKDFLEKYGTDTLVVVPLVCRDEAIGVILADNIYRNIPISEEGIRLLNFLANQSAIALNNAYAYQDLQKKVEMLEAALVSLQEVHEKLVLSEKLAAIGKLAAKVAHEIRNPLATIGGFARAILRAPGDSNKVSKQTEIIIEEVERLEKLLSNIMNFSRPSEMKMGLISLQEVVEDSIMMTQNKMLEKRINFHYIKNDPDLKAFIDGPQVKQVVLNIIHNALESVEEKGTVEITLGRRQDFAEISVSDNGPGVPLEERENIFKPFYSTKKGGTGLGLCISKEIIENHGGKIEVDGGADKPTIFSILIPLEKKKLERVEGGNDGQIAYR